MDDVFDLVNLLNSLSDRNILDRSFNDQGNTIKKCSVSFINDLETITITDSDVDNNMCCAICQDEFKLGDKAIKLPCSDSHYFHCSSDKELCGGILPWFKNNNNCPICRTEFPEEPEPDIPIPDGNFDVEEDVVESGEEIINDIDNMSSELDNIIQRIFTIRPVTNPNQPLPSINLRSSIYIPNLGLPLPNPTNNLIPPIFTIYPINIPMNNYNEDEDPDLQEAIRLSLG